MSQLNQIVLVRHGDTTGHSSIRYHGRNDVALSNRGRRQAESARDQLGDFHFDHIYSSSLARAWQTATVLVPGARIETLDALQEIDFGRWEGLTREEIAEADPELFVAWNRGLLNFEFPEGETQANFIGRVERGMETMLTTGGESVLVVAHKGVVRILAEVLTGVSLPSAIPKLGQMVVVERQEGSDYTFRIPFDP